MQSYKTQGQRRKWTRSPTARGQWSPGLCPCCRRRLASSSSRALLPLAHYLEVLHAAKGEEASCVPGQVTWLLWTWCQQIKRIRLVVARASSSSQSCFNHQLPVGVKQASMKVLRTCVATTTRVGLDFSSLLVRACSRTSCGGVWGVNAQCVTQSSLVSRLLLASLTCGCFLPGRAVGVT